MDPFHADSDRARGDAAPQTSRPQPVLTLWSVVEGREPVTLVSHDDDDHGWQFLAGKRGRPDPAQAVLTPLDELLAQDPSLAEVTDLPLGWIATRTAPEAPWVRQKLHQGFMAHLRAVVDGVRPAPKPEPEPSPYRNKGIPSLK